MKKMLDGTSIWVIMFGVMVGVSLLLQCMIPFLTRMAHAFGNDSWLVMTNVNFVLPMDVITSFWAAISAAYVGFDRGAFTLATLRGEYNKLETGNPGRNRQVIKLSFGIYALAVLLNVFFDAELSLGPLMSSFGASVLLYVSGQRSILAASKFAPELIVRGNMPDTNENGINDRVEEVLRKLEKSKVDYAVYALKDGRPVKRMIMVKFDG